ncbi:replication factor C subunit 1 [Belonocnema kinseyi]|uniref:replication factor C subunit 1 n=1 Tax=Belonocnema kinseyi TaxID=2817044 RepID=UPI00143D1224|nr:replication factor C subunit 1 [Belonocnema kinseyi]
MSKDIRSYFITSKPSTSKPSASRKGPVISSDEDDEKSSKIQKKSKITEKKRRKHALSDSEDEEIVVKKIKNEKKESISPKNHKVITPAELFGKTPIKREAAPKVVRKPKEPQDNKIVGKKSRKSKKNKKEVKPEIGFHDDDLDSSLVELDEEEIVKSLAAAEAKKLAETKSSNGDPEKPEETNDSKVEEKEKETPTVSTVSEKIEKQEVKKEPKKSTDSSPEKSKLKEENSLGPKTSGVKRKSNNKHSKLEIDVNEKGSKKAKLNESADMFEEIIEKKKQSAALYQQFLQRGGARNPGSKEIPVGADFCLAGLSFLVTGVLDSLERDEAEELIKKYGGRMLHSISRKTDYVILGDQPGPAKVAKAESMKIPTISEDDLLNMIRTRSAGKSSSVKQSQTKHKVTVRPKSPDPEPIHPISPKKVHRSPEKNAVLEEDLKKSAEKSEKEKDEGSSLKEEESKSEESASIPNGFSASLPEIRTDALVEKYRPQTMKQLIGQQGEKSNAKKLYNWLSNWHKNRGRNMKHSKPTPWKKDDDGAFFKAVLLSGPPGIGKTTSVYVVAKELGFDLLEFNASDTRSKRLLKDEVAGLLSNTTVKGYFTNEGEKSEKPAKKHVLMMDEVDGMAGNEDRGGLQELIGLIKTTDIPIICVCNDRNNPKMRTLSNYTFDLKFPKPRIEQIKGAMMSLCYKEKITIKPEDLIRLIESTNQDIRQVINHLALLGANIECKKETEGNRLVNKDLKLGPWDVARKVFSAEEHKKMSIHDKSDLFFHDYSIASLFVQENYLSVVPAGPRKDILERVAKSADSLSMGDLIDNAIRGNGAWSLLPTQAMFSSVMPGSFMSGNMTSAFNFPAWLGRNSTRNKMDRLLQEITVHARVTTGASKESLNLDYLPHLRDSITKPLISGDVESAVNVMTQYHLMREDLDSIVEVSLWPGSRNPMQFIESKVKAAFTRAYNKHAATAPYAMTAGKKKKGGASPEEEFEDEDGDNSEEDDDIDIEKMVKAKKPAASKKASSKDEEKPSTSKKVVSSKDEDKPKRGKGHAKAKKESA